MGSFNRNVVLVTTVYAIGLATAARTEGYSQAYTLKAAETPTKPLNTYYFDVSATQIELSPRTSSRPERTAVTVKLAEEGVSRFMPVVSPQAAGMTHAVSNTWQALKNLATMFTYIEAINKQHPTAECLFPRAALAVTGASDNAPVKLDMEAIIKHAEAIGDRNAWAEVTPSSVLLLPAGQSTGAVADVLGVTFDAQTNTITLELDLVHNPHTTSEFEPHGKQTLDVQEAHYHFSTAPGVKVDAQALLSSLQSGGPGFAAQVYVNAVEGFIPRAPTGVFINCEGGISAPVSKVQLMPPKAYRHVHDPVTLTALALDASSKPVAGAKIAFSEYGDCDATMDQTVATTGADGIAAIGVVADKPGVVSVVAAGVNTEGAPVLSEPSNIFFFSERHEADHREQEYYGEHYNGQHVHEGSDAYGYPKSAAHGAQQKVQQAT